MNFSWRPRPGLSYYLVLRVILRQQESSQPKSAARAGETYFKIKLLSSKRVEDHFFEDSSVDLVVFLLLIKPRIRLIECPLQARRFWHSVRGHPAIKGAGTNSLDSKFFSKLRLSGSVALGILSTLSLLLLARGVVSTNSI